MSTMSLPDPPPRPEGDDETLDSLVLLRRAQSGEKRAYDDLFQRYYDRVRVIASRRLGEELREDLETFDVLNEAMLSAFQSFDRFELRDESSFLAWLTRVVENRIRNLSRRKRAAKRDHGAALPLADGGGTLTTIRPGVQPEAEDPSPSVKVDRREQLEKLKAALGELKEKSRRVILLAQRYEHDWTVVAERVGAPSPDAARMLYTRAKEELRRVMAKRRY